MGLLDGNITFTGDCAFSKSVSVPSGTIRAVGIAANAGIEATKLQHRHKIGTNFDLAHTGTPVSREEIVYVATATCAINSFKALLFDTGTDTAVAFDCQVNGVTILASTVDLTHATTDRATTTGTLSTTALATGDVVTISIATTSSTGASGPFAWVEIDESAS